MAQLQEYKCPSCGGAISFDAKSQNMKCPYCDTEFDVETLKEYDAALSGDTGDDMKWETGTGNEWNDSESDGLRAYVCNSCGGEIVCDENTAATSCPFCGNPVVMMEKLSGVLRPDYVIPFKLDKKAAKEGLKKHFSKKPLLPDAFADENHIDEIKGIYVPFWLFDADADVKVRYNATKVRSWSSSEYIYTETSHFLLYRAGNLSFERVPVDGSTKMADDLMESIEPYDFSGAVNFQTAYLAGYLADKYDVDADESADRANQRIKSSSERIFSDTVIGYTTVIPASSNVRLSGGRTKYALYPVWMLNTTWKGRRYVFAMNGQTGKFVGDLPVDKKKAAIWALCLTVGCAALVYGAAWLLWLMNIIG